MIQSKITRLCVVSATLLLPLTAAAQQGPGWFVPGGGQQRPPAGQTPRAPTPQPPGLAPGVGGGQTDEQQPPLPPLQVALPPLPEIPDVPKGAPPPGAVIGILSVPDVLRISVAYQAADKELGARRQKLNEDAQREQAALRDIGQALVRDRAKMTPEQVRAKEREYEERVNASRIKFGERNRIIQEAGQYVIAQIDRTLEAVTQKVAIARGVNLVLNRAQLLGTTVDFDLTPQVAEVLNKVLPSVAIPPDGVSVSQMVQNAPGGITAPPTPQTPVPLVVPPTPAAPTPAPAAPVPAAPAPAPPKR
jgi:Skp family chaperone for outer membrane proteins